MKNISGLFGAVVLIVMLFVSPGVSLASDPAPDFSLQDLNGTTITLSQFKNKKSVMMIFWTTWCPFCQEQLKVIQSRFNEIIKDGIEILAIDVQERQNKIISFVRNRKFPFKVLLDNDAEVAGKYGLFGVPTYVIVDKSGNIVYKDNIFPEYKKLLGL